mmetsp:Transcript_1990/g.5518  ORF Transcript_1990/g.5518 Transcript_1990/m.5518 type:complete len:336 (+) Transcript_1990:53-1060(+)
MAKEDSKCWAKWLDGKIVRDVLPGGMVVHTVRGDEGVLDALERLAEKKVLSLPVYDVVKKEYNALVDLPDLLTLAVVTMKCKGVAEAFRGSEIPWKEYLAKELEMLRGVTVAEVVGAASALKTAGGPVRCEDRNPWCPIWEEYPLHSLLDIFGREVNIHRVPVIDGNGEMVAIVSQSRIVDFLVENLAALGEARHARPAARPITDAVRSVDASAPLVDAYAALLESGYSGVAVVDDKGALAGALSASDLRILGYDIALLLQSMSGTVAEFQRAHKPKTAELVQNCTIQQNATVEEILRKFHENKVHRLFCVGDDGVPTGVVSLCDVISTVHDVSL